MAIGYTF